MNLSWPFATGGMLFWALAAIIPILIHLWARRRYQDVRWAATRFLMKALKQNSKRITIEQIILMLVRCSIFVFLALALANPYSKSGVEGKSVSDQKKKHHIFVVDTSYSMDLRYRGRCSLDTAKVAANAIIDESAVGDGFTLVQLQNVPIVTNFEPSFDRQQMKFEVDRLKTTPASISVSGFNDEIRRVIERARNSHPELSETTVNLYSDFQRKDWNDDVLRKIANLTTDDLTLNFNHVGNRDAENNFVSELRPSNLQPRSGDEVTFQARIENFGSLSKQIIPVDFVVDEDRVERRTVEVEPNENVSVAFNITLETPGKHSAKVRLPDDSLSIDNERYFSIYVADRTNILCLEGKKNAARFFELALMSEENLEDAGRFVERVPFDSIDDLNLFEFDVVALFNVPSFQKHQADAIHQFVKEGGGLIISLGDSIQPSNYNEMLGPDSDLDVIDLRMESFSDYGSYGLDPLGYRHLILNPFRGNPNSGLLSTPIWKYVRSAKTENSNVVMNFDSGDPAVAVSELENGKVIVYCGAFSSSSTHRDGEQVLPWTEFQTWPSFPVVVNEMVQFAEGGKVRSLNLSIGDPLRGSFKTTFKSNALRLFDPDGNKLELNVQFSRGRKNWSGGSVKRVGFYQLQSEGEQSMTNLYASNINCEESRLESLSRKEMTNWNSESPSKEDKESDAPTQSSDRYFFQWMLLIVLILVILDTVLSFVFGRNWLFKSSGRNTAATRSS